MEHESTIPIEDIEKLAVSTTEKQYANRFRIASIAGSIIASIATALAIKHNLVDTDQALIASGILVMGNLYFMNKLRVYTDTIDEDIAYIEQEILRKTHDRDQLLMEGELTQRGLRIEAIETAKLTEGQQRRRQIRRWITDTISSAAQVLSNAIP